MDANLVRCGTMAGVTSPAEPSDPTAAAAAPTALPAAPLPLRTQLVRFVLAGGVSAVVDYGLMVAGMNLLGLGYSPAKAISWVFGTLTAYLINSRWTFQAAGSKKTLGAVVVLYLLTFALQVGTFTVLYPPLAAWLGVTAAQLVGFVIAQGIATTVNFIVQRGLIFRGR